MLNKILFLLAAAIVMAGCSSTAHVERTPGTFTALTIPVVSDLWVNGVLQLSKKNKKGCGEFSKNMLPATSDQDFTVDMEANQDTFFHISRADAQVECNKYGIFYVTKGNQYILNLETKNKQCEISLIEKTPNGAQSKIKTYPVYVSTVDGIKVCENKDKLY